MSALPPRRVETNPDQPHQSADHIASSRPKFYKRPDIPGNAEILPSVVISQPPPKTEIEDPQPASRIRTVAVQTMYRDSEAQTGTWDPEYVVDPDDDNEVRPHSKFSRASY